MNERIIPTDSIRWDESKVFHLTNTNVLSNVTKLLELPILQDLRMLRRLIDGA
jgi:hypothetical protein